jgi:hypothetical protein
MMRAMEKGWVGCMHLAAGACCVLMLVACGGEGKQADSPGNCPEGTVLRGSDCVPPGAANDTSEKWDESSSSSSSSTSPSSGSSSEGASTSHGGKPKKPASTGSSDGDSTWSEPPPSSGGKTPYDKDAVEIELKRAARQVKANCGSATDEGGGATGPWGKTTANVTLGRNGHIKEVTVPAPYDGKPVGVCVVHAFQKIQFPPYAGSSDVALTWDIELVPPKK